MSHVIRKYVLIALFLCLLAGTAHAQLFLEEGKVVLPVSGGEHVNKSFTLHNTSSKELEVRVYLEDFQYEPPYDGTKSFVPAGTGKASISKWISFRPQIFKIPSLGTQKIEYSISVPENAQGGYYGVIFFETMDDPLKNKEGVSVVTRVGGLLFIESKDKIKKATLENIELTNHLISGHFINQGNTVLIPRMTYNIMDKEGLVLDRGELKKIYVPPGASAEWNVLIPKNLKVKNCSMVINTDLEEGIIVVKELELVKDAAGHFSIANIRD